MYDEADTRAARSHPTMTEPDRSNPFKGVASPTLHRIILLTDRLAEMSGVGQAVFVASCTALVTLVWGAVLDLFMAGLIIASINLFFTLSDWAGLVLLIRHKRSFGPVASGLIAFGGIRCLFTLLMALLAARPFLASTLMVVGHLALTSFMLNSMWGEPFRLGVTRLTYRSPKLDRRPPLRILHLTDFHVERLTRREARALALIDELRPDLIVYTGDLLSFSYIDDPIAQAECRSLMARLHAPLGVYAITGTPLVDTGPAVQNVLGGLDNIILLRDAMVSPRQHAGLTIIGVTCTHNSAIDSARLEQLIAGLPLDAYILLLYHAPDLMPEAAKVGVDLVLCGHTHGGQIRLPGIGALFTSSHYWKRYEMGEYRVGNTIMYVSRGIGMEGKGMPRMRFLCEPEIELIELRGTLAAEESLREKVR